MEAMGEAVAVVLGVGGLTVAVAAQSIRWVESRGARIGQTVPKRSARFQKLPKRCDVTVWPLQSLCSRRVRQLAPWNATL